MAQASSWSVTCDAELYCIARTPLTGTPDAEARLKIERGNSDGGRVFVSVGTGPELAEGMVVAIEALGGGLRHEGAIDKVYRGNEMTFAEPARGPIVEALRAAGRAQVTVQFGGGIGTRVHDAALDGLTAALLEIDQRQGRVGHASAMVAWGSATGARDGAPVPDAPDQAAEPPEPGSPPAIMEDFAVGSGEIIYERTGLPAQIVAISDAYGCGLDEALGAWGAKALGLGQGRRLFIVPCHNADINIESHVTLLGPDGMATPLQFESPPGENAPMRPTLINPDYDAPSGLLRATAFDSPEGGCGTFERHRLLADQLAFELIEQREKPDCDTTIPNPEDWPLAWTIDEMGG
ncbi:MAG: DUF1176 domain-containing protein [Rhizobiaceae bacterium]|nr:DUF1176 domain-containing protein [Rhizobiaceae bacterium]